MKNSYIHPLPDYKVPSTDLTPAHTGALTHALDFDCPEGTEVHAAADGNVVFIKDDSNTGGFDPKYNNDGNRIVLQHAHGEYTAYEHLRYHGAIVKLGQEVQRGDILGYSGNTGWSSCPHLHFEVFIRPRNSEFDGETIEVEFLD